MVLMLAAGAADQTAAAAPSQPAPVPAQAKEADNDPMICRRIQEIGSLLKSHRVCMHKSDWNTQQQSDRDAIERGQTQHGIYTPG
jgi:predicted secreted protein